MARDGGELRVSPTSRSQGWPSGFPAAALNVIGTAPLAILKFKKTLKKVLTFHSGDAILLKVIGELTRSKPDTKLQNEYEFIIQRWPCV